MTFFLSRNSCIYRVRNVLVDRVNFFPECFTDILYRWAVLRALHGLFFPYAASRPTFSPAAARLFYFMALRPSDKPVFPGSRPLYHDFSLSRFTFNPSRWKRTILWPLRGPLFFSCAKLLRNTSLPHIPGLWRCEPRFLLSRGPIFFQPFARTFFFLLEHCGDYVFGVLGLGI